MVIGGKVGTNFGSCNFSDTVIGYNMQSIFEPWTKVVENSGWSTKAKMNSPRANFAHLVLDNFVYVFAPKAWREHFFKEV